MSTQTIQPGGSVLVPRYNAAGRKISERHIPVNYAEAVREETRAKIKAQREWQEFLFELVSR